MPLTLLSSLNILMLKQKSFSSPLLSFILLPLMFKTSHLSLVPEGQGTTEIAE